MKKFLPIILISTLILPAFTFASSKKIAKKTPIKVQRKIANKESKKDLSKLRDCQEGMTAIDIKIIEEILSKTNILKEESESAEDFAIAVERLVSEYMDDLSEAAKASLAQSLFKNSLASSESDEFKRAFNDFMTAVDFHTRTFGPNGTYSRIGFFDAVFGNAYKLYTQSWRDVQNKFRAMLPVIEKLRLSEDQLQELTDRLGQFNSNLNENINNRMFDGSQKRLEAERGILLQIGAAAMLAVVTGGASTIGSAASLSATATAAIGGGASLASYSLIVGQGKLAAQALLSGNDFGCEYSLRAYKENPKIAKVALVNGVIGAITAGAGSAILSKTGHSERVMEVLHWGGKALTAKAVVTIAWEGKKSWSSYKKANELLEESSKAYKQRKFKEAAKLETEALHQLEEAREAAVGAGAHALELIAIQINTTIAKKLAMKIQKEQYEIALKKAVDEAEVVNKKANEAYQESLKVFEAFEKSRIEVDKVSSEMLQLQIQINMKKRFGGSTVSEERRLEEVIKWLSTAGPKPSLPIGNMAKETGAMVTKVTVQPSVPLTPPIAPKQVETKTPELDYSAVCKVLMSEVRAELKIAP